MQIPELLAPAGDLEKAYYAFLYGADAIYCGSPIFSLRTRMNNFTENELKEILEFAKKNKKKVYVTLNGFPHQNMMDILKKHLEFLKTIKPHGLIIADTGVLSLANKIIPEIPKHLSVQATTLNAEAIQFWQQNGVERIILARELSLKEVIKLKKINPKVEMECFVHGAMCMAYSGRCLLSNFFTGRDANRGACAHSCRWKYRVYDSLGQEILWQKDKNNDLRAKEKICYIEEELRQGEFVKVEEDFHGTYLFSSRDMCLIEYLKNIAEAGVDSIKIEGRNKTIYYLATIIRAYRVALDDLKNNKPFNKNLWQEIRATANRGFFAGFLHGKPNIEGQQYEANSSESDYDFVGIVKKWENKKVLLEVKNRIDLQDEIEFVYPNIVDDFKLKVTGLWKEEQEVEALHGGNGDGWLNCLKKVEKGVLVRKKRKGS